MKYYIEVAVNDGTSTTERGGLLERFARKFLECLHLSVKEQVRLTASEVDLLAEDTQTSEKHFVECKAYRSNISSEVLQKLLGNVVFKNYSSGWLISTFDLSKDAKGFEVEWNQRPVEDRRRLRIFTPENLIPRLISASVIFDPSKLPIDLHKFKVGNEATLSITSRGQFWVIPLIDKNTLIPNSSLLFDASNGQGVSSKDIFDWFSTTDSTACMPCVSQEKPSEISATSKLKLELESIVRVPVADHWADYRPARPEDYVGRETIQAEVFNFFDKVRTGTTNTRQIAIKAPSGWGKSSSVLKIAAKASNKRNKNKYFVFTADSRAATTKRFPELAVISAIKEALKIGFLSSEEETTFGSTANLFTTQQMEDIAQQLRGESKLICVFFDQFEELLYKADLVEIFDEVRRLCSALEEAQINIVIGFSWKTDGVIPTEHNAYHMWHSLADRRFEIELPPFTEQEVSLAINRFGTELGQPVIPQLRRLLHDHCQGFPWLLKKLCVHILQAAKGGVEQIDTLNRSINISTLFKRDLEGLNSQEIGCIRQIAAQSPAEFFKIAQNFGDDVISRLVDRRLVIRSGTKLTLYWDIFRDYILTDKIPYIPVTYIPQIDFSRYVRALKSLLLTGKVSYKDLGSKMNLSDGATDNIVRDMVNIGHVEANRKEAKIMPSFTSEHEAIALIIEFWRSHEVFRRLQASRTETLAFTEEEFLEIFRETNRRSGLGSSTLRTYGNRVLRWLSGVGMISPQGQSYVIDTDEIGFLSSLEDIIIPRGSKGSLFVGSAPPTKICEAITDIITKSFTKEDLVNKYNVNTYSCLQQLKIFDKHLKPVIPVPTNNIPKFLAGIASNTSSLLKAKDILRNNPEIRGLELGHELGLGLETEWTHHTKKRNGNAIKVWARWTHQILRVDD
ncbi:restriction endonuclease [Pseudomonas sp.]|uniref:restriction endonuclease n=1 Tax=Pseudomonas sp. TaxID=306 RepID=UPI0026DBC168|nr:restriction endonuclease [Pseudomonas sp.]MDO4234308.1 restriction endonuclease [Pseudomonas sp.]